MRIMALLLEVYGSNLSQGTDLKQNRDHLRLITQINATVSSLKLFALIIVLSVLK
jgi:hypothetical protein